MSLKSFLQMTLNFWAPAVPDHPDSAGGRGAPGPHPRCLRSSWDQASSQEATFPALKTVCSSSFQCYIYHWFTINAVDLGLNKHSKRAGKTFSEAMTRVSWDQNWGMNQEQQCGWRHGVGLGGVWGSGVARISYLSVLNAMWTEVVNCR